MCSSELAISLKCSCNSYWFFLKVSGAAFFAFMNPVLFTFYFLEIAHSFWVYWWSSVFFWRTVCVCVWSTFPSNILKDLRQQGLWAHSLPSWILILLTSEFKYICKLFVVILIGQFSQLLRLAFTFFSNVLHISVVSLSQRFMVPVTPL